MNGKNYSCHPATVEWFSIQILVNLKFSLNVSLIPSGLEDCLKSFSDRGSEISTFPARFEQQLTHPYRTYSMKRRRWKYNYNIVYSIQTKLPRRTWINVA